MNKFIILLVLLFEMAACSMAQINQTTVLLFATTHNFGSTSKENFKKTISVLKSFNPDNIYIESIPQIDSIGIKKIWYRHLKLADSIRIANELSPQDVYDSVIFYKDRFQNYNDTNSLSKLAYYYFLSGDISNYTSFLYWKLNETCSCSNNELLKTYRRLFDYGEFWEIIFPLADSLPNVSLIPVDDRSNSPKDEYFQHKAFKNILFSPKVFSLLRKYNKIKKAYREHEMDSNLIELINDEDYQNKISGIIERLYPDWSKNENAKQVSEMWKIRNRKIADNIIADIGSKQPKRIVIAFGAAHIPLLKKYLSENNELNIITYSLYLKSL